MKKEIIIGSILALLVGFGGIFVGFNASSLANNVSGVNQPSQMAVGQNMDMNAAIEFVKKLMSMVGSMGTTGSVEDAKVEIADMATKLAGNYNSPAVDSIVTDVLGVLANPFDSVASLLGSVVQTLQRTLTDLLAGVMNSGLTYDQMVTIDAETAAKEQGLSEPISLNGYIYYASGEKSTKWVVLVHPFMTSGNLMASILAEPYLEMGYNVIAPDLRGFGRSEGAVAMGWLESLDIWDWLNYINDSTNVFIGSRAATDVIIHGISLGGATTLQTWTQVGFGRDLTDMDVIGVIDDCGYSSMNGIIESMLTDGAAMELLGKIAGIANKDNLYDLIGDGNVKNLLQNVIKVGINDADWDLKSNALAAGRVKSDVPIMVIHGTSDTMVAYSISEKTVVPSAKASNLLYEFWSVKGQQHAFVIIGMNKTEYINKVNKFVKYAESRVPGSNVAQEDDGTEEKEEDEGSFIDKIGKAISNFFGSIGNFFKNLFS